MLDVIQVMIDICSFIYRKHYIIARMKNYGLKLFMVGVLLICLLNDSNAWRRGSGHRGRCCARKRCPGGQRCIDMGTRCRCRPYRYAILMRESIDATHHSYQPV